MAAQPVADVIELEQLLARYAVGMTKDDVDAVIDVFTPDGTYSAFGDTYPLADFPALVAAAPKGLFLVGPPCSSSTATPVPAAAALLRRPDRPTTCGSATTPTPTAGRPTGWRLHTRAMTFLRKSGARDSGRAHDPDPSPAHRPVTGSVDPAVDLDEFRVSLDAWLDDNAAALAARLPGDRDARPADGPAGQGQAAGLRRRLDAVRAGRSGSVASAGRP